MEVIRGGDQRDNLQAVCLVGGLGFENDRLLDGWYWDGWNCVVRAFRVPGSAPESEYRNYDRGLSYVCLGVHEGGRGLTF